MKDDQKTKKQLIEELNERRQRAAELEGLEEEIGQMRADYEKFTRAFIQSSVPVGITTFKEGRFVEVSDAFLRLMGRKRNEVIGHTATGIRFITEEQRRAFFYELNKKGRVENLEMKVRAKDGALIEGLFNAVMMSIKNEKYLLTVMTDITERKQVEEALRESQQQLHQITDNVPVFMNCVTAQDLRYKFVNKHFADAFGKLPEEMIGKQVKEILPEDAYLRALPYIDRARSGELIQYENIVSIHGEPHWFSIDYIPEIDDQGTVNNITVLASDTTERKRAEAEKAKLEAQNWQLQKTESLGRMAGAIAHHFNNQLGVVIGNLEMAIDDLTKSAGPIKKLTTAMEAANRAAEMSSLMLTYIGQTSDKHEPIDLSEVCLRSIPIIQPTIANNVVLKHDLPTSGPVISANANQIRQIMTNLTTNALEAIGEDGGTIHLRVKTIHQAEIPSAHRYPLGWQPQDNPYACLEVMDTGSGIKDQDVEKLYDPFFTTKFTGRGLGLPVVMGIVKAHGGAVTMESVPGQGSVFRVFFPMSGEGVIPQPDKADQLLATEGGGTVLLVEDEEMVREVAAAMLNRLGFSALEAKDGVEAVEVFRQRQDEICCVLSDLTMPHMNGWETLAALRKLVPGIPVILASGYDKVHVMAGYHPELPQVFLGKPYKLKGLSDAISQALAGKK